MSGTRTGSKPGLRVTGVRIAVVAARFHGDIVEGLLAGARRTLTAHGVPGSAVDVFDVPGAWELPLAAAHVADRGHHEVILALGAVIRGDTPHFDQVCAGCTDGLMKVQLEYGLPVAFGVLTCDDIGQARRRSSADGDNKGAEAALAALEMVELIRRIDG